jgi:hypothetical protein
VPLEPACQPLPLHGTVGVAHQSAPRAALPRSLVLPPAPNRYHRAPASSRLACQPPAPASSCPTILPYPSRARHAREACAAGRCRSSPELPRPCHAGPCRRTLAPPLRSFSCPHAALSRPPLFPRRPVHRVLSKATGRRPRSPSPSFSSSSALRAAAS